MPALGSQQLEPPPTTGGQLFWQSRSVMHEPQAPPSDPPSLPPSSVLPSSPPLSTPPPSVSLAGPETQPPCALDHSSWTLKPATVAFCQAHRSPISSPLEAAHALGNTG